jgi:hypothetical protein
VLAIALPELAAAAQGSAFSWRSDGTGFFYTERGATFGRIASPVYRLPRRHEQRGPWKHCRALVASIWKRREQDDVEEHSKPQTKNSPGLERCVEKETNPVV